MIQLTWSQMAALQEKIDAVAPVLPSIEEYDPLPEDHDHTAAVTTSSGTTTVSPSHSIKEEEKELSSPSPFDSLFDEPGVKVSISQRGSHTPEIKKEVNTPLSPSPFDSLFDESGTKVSTSRLGVGNGGKEKGKKVRNAEARREELDAMIDRKIARRKTLGFVKRWRERNPGWRERARRGVVRRM